jgi:serine/threonine protein kinase/formylglycine-generating enzyme required for sulfatase activity
MGQLPTPARELPCAFGRYKLLKLLGEGGMGAVYLAHDEQLDRNVALKIPNFETGEKSQVLARFNREARSAAALRHANICPVHEVGEIDGVPYLTMAFIEGKPLSQFEQDLNPRQVALLVRKLALALQEAHRQGIIHRDLKPDNIMMDRRGEPIIMDFGLARRSRGEAVRLTQSGAALGTPAYMPPEQVQGKLDDMGPPSDIYSLGVILYELLAGRLPFSAGDAMAMLSQVLLDEPPPPSQFRPDLDRALDAICLKAMAKKTVDRYASMADMATALADYLRGSPQQAPPPVSAPPPSKSAPATISPKAPGYQVSQMGGLRSVAQLRAEIPERTAPEAPSRRRRKRKSRSRGMPIWLWVAGGGVLAVVLVVIGFLVFSRPNHAATDSERTQPVVQQTATHPQTTKLANNAPKPVSLAESWGMKFVHVPAATFWMGAPGKDSQHVVRIDKDFEMAVFTVTQEQWQSVMGNNPSWFSRQGGGKDKVKDISDADLKQFPVEMVSWNDVQEYLTKLNEREKGNGWRYRLPTEAEWEYACRAAAASKEESSFRFYFDQPTNEIDPTKANYDCAAPDGHPAKGVPLGRTCKVGMYRPNRLGLHDMHGNVVEWCEDLFEGGPDRVARGGGWRCNSVVCSAGFRNHTPPTDRLDYLGFRLVRVPALAGQAAGAPDHKDSAAPSDWHPLFNGKDLSGWKYHPGQPGDWTVPNGLLTSGGARNHLFTERGDFENFHLHAEAKINAAGNSGIFFRSEYGLNLLVGGKTGNYPAGYEAQIYLGGPEKTNRTGSLLPGVEVNDRLVEPDAWFTLDVIAEGAHLVIRVNDKTTVDTQDTQRRFNGGHIALQHSDPNTLVQFRKIEIKELPSGSAKTDNTPQGVDVTKDFVNPDNWECLPKYWQINNGVITGLSPANGLRERGTFLCSKKKYKDFELKCQIKLLGGPDANSGIQIRSEVADRSKFTVWGPQADIAEGRWGDLAGENFDKEGRRGDDHLMKQANRFSRLAKPGEFNDYYIKCVGKHVTIKVNGMTTVYEDFNIMPDEGIIAFQLHATKTRMEVIFKDFEFKELK